MKNNFGLILLDLVRSNKDKFLGLLRRNGVLVDADISNEELTNRLINAMKKSQSFYKEGVILMSVLLSDTDNSFANFTLTPTVVNSLNEFTGNLQSNQGSTSTGFASTAFPTSIGFTPSILPTSTSGSSSGTVKDFEDTTVGTIFDKLFTLGQGYLTNKELDVRAKEAMAGQAIAQNTNNSNNNDVPKKDNTLLYVLLTLGGLSLLGVSFYVISKKK